MRVAKPLLLSSPEECEQAFYEALEAGDSEAVVDLWLEDDDVVCIHPGGPRLTGYCVGARFVDFDTCQRAAARSRALWPSRSKRRRWRCIT